MSTIKKILINPFKSYKGKLASAIAGLFIVGQILTPQVAFAANVTITNYPSFNRHVDNHINEETETLKIARSGETWEDSITGIKPGDTVSFYVYYHNNRETIIYNAFGKKVYPTIAYNTRLRVDVPQGSVRPVGTTATIPVTAYVWAENSKNYEPYTPHNPEGKKYAKDWGTISVTTPNPVKLTYIEGSTIWYPDLADRNHVNPKPLLYNQGGWEILTSEGLGIGDIQSCWEHKGVVTFKMKVEEVATAKLSIEKTVDKHTANPGDPLVYSIKYQVMDGAARNVKITDILPPNVELTETIPTYTRYNTSGNEIIWELGDLSANSTGEIYIKAQISRNLQAEGIHKLTNHARISAANLPDASSEVTTTVTIVKIQTYPVLHIKKYVSKDGQTWYNFSEDNKILTAAPGDILRYKVLVWNTGTASATNVKVSDDIAANNTGYYINIGPFDGNYGTVSYLTNNTEAKAVVREFTVTVNPAGYPVGNTYVNNTATIVGNDQNANLGASSSTRTVVSVAEKPVIKPELPKALPSTGLDIAGIAGATVLLASIAFCLLSYLNERKRLKLEMFKPVIWLKKA